MRRRGLCLVLSTKLSSSRICTVWTHPATIRKLAAALEVDPRELLED
jgi:hypothetical protein